MQWNRTFRCPTVIMARPVAGHRNVIGSWYTEIDVADDFRAPTPDLVHPTHQDRWVISGQVNRAEETPRDHAQNQGIAALGPVQGHDHGECPLPRARPDREGARPVTPREQRSRPPRTSRQPSLKI